MIATFRNWALDESPSSRQQAAWGNRYRIWLNLRSNPLGMIGLTIIVVFVALSMLAPLLASHDPATQELANRLAAPSAAHWFGTDELGRDIYSRLLYGGRLARAETMTVRGSDFIAAYRLTGGSAWRIIFRHIAPLCMPSLIVRVTLDMSSIIITAASLGFLGMGAQPPSPEWGAMIATAKRFIFEQWWVATIPGVAIFLVSLAFNFLGDALRDVLDPKGA
jgi:ABC-type dipeptide/oligopeptide/nickel transport system permease subunit